MAISYYDDAITEKLKGWLASNSQLKILSPDETNRLLTLMADESGDKPVQLPLLTISRNKDLELTSAIKQNRSFDGKVLATNAADASTAHLNVLPIKTTYQIDIYTKRQLEADEYVRQYLFKLINNPQICVEIPYNGASITHTANLRVLSTVSDTSDVANRLFPGQFYRWTIQLELQDGFLFSIPYRRNWRVISVELVTAEKITDPVDFDVLEQKIC